MSGEDITGAIIFMLLFIPIVLWTIDIMFGSIDDDDEE
jgi:hypothetical protein